MPGWVKFSAPLVNFLVSKAHFRAQLVVSVGNSFGAEIYLLDRRIVLRTLAICTNVRDYPAVLVLIL